MDLNLPSNVTEVEETDVLGGGVLDSGIYQGTVDLVYLDAADSGAKRINIHFTTSNGQTVRNTVYISNKLGSFTYKDKKSGADTPLPGYSQMNAFFNAVTDKGIGEQTVTKKTIKVYDFTAKADKPTEVDVFTDTLGKKIAAGILRISEEITRKDSENPNNPPYSEGTGEFREKNEFDKFFDATSGLTYAEKKAGTPTPVFLDKWKNKNTGKTRTKKAKVPGTASSTTTNTSGAAKLFDNVFAD